MIKRTKIAIVLFSALIFNGGSFIPCKGPDLSLNFQIVLNRIQFRNIMKKKNTTFEIMKKAYKMIMSLSVKYVPHIESLTSRELWDLKGIW